MTAGRVTLYKKASIRCALTNQIKTPERKIEITMFFVFLGADPLLLSVWEFNKERMFIGEASGLTRSVSRRNAIFSYGLLKIDGNQIKN